MAGAKHHVTIKGTKQGLVFHLSDQCDFPDLLRELQFKLEKTHQHILTGPLIHVQIKMGKRATTLDQKEELRKLMKQRGNLIIQSIESEVTLPDKPPPDSLEIMKGIIRSGQSIHHDRSILFLGDVNPGGSIVSAGNIFILGSLRGMAHAGAEGNLDSVIAASYLQPTQLRIADMISRPPDEWGISEAFMEFAYLHNGSMEIDKIVHLQRIRPNITEFKGE